jgi:hypothetical protein
MSNAERRLKNVELGIRGTYECHITTNKVSFLASRLLYLVSISALSSSKCPTSNNEERRDQTSIDFGQWTVS